MKINKMSIEKLAIINDTPADQVKIQAAKDRGRYTDEQIRDLRLNYDIFKNKFIGMQPLGMPASIIVYGFTYNKQEYPIVSVEIIYVILQASSLSTFISFTGVPSNLHILRFNLSTFSSNLLIRTSSFFTNFLSISSPNTDICVRQRAVIGGRFSSTTSNI